MVIVLLAVLCGVPAVSHAALSPASPFTDHMVLQRDRQVPVWGTADPGERITVQFGAQKKTTRAGGDGTWQIQLAPLRASAAPATLSISGSATPEPLVLSDVLVGEVWLASGQSNMVFTLSKGRYPWAGVIDEQREIAAADYPQIRIFTGEAARRAVPQTRVAGRWVGVSPATAGELSAVGYYFARDLQQRLKVPVGIIVLAYGASTAEAWISRPALTADPQIKPLLDSFDAKVRAYAADSGKDPVQDQHNATVLFNGMLNPVVPYAIRGVIWYQGESITNGEVGRALYPRVQAALVRDWRRQWRDPGLPFYICQLAGQEAASNSPVVREAQATILALPHTEMAVTMDLGEAHDVHPHNKKDVGNRLALIALAKRYGQRDEYSGPRYESLRVAPGQLKLKFSHARGLMARDGGPVQGFEIAGADGRYQPADASIDDATITLRSAAVAAPVAARYAWANFPHTANLVNAARLPAGSFRTDRTQ